jgi:hypothetical protein
LLFFLQSQTHNQEETDKAVCSYIAGMLENNYNEYGEIVVGREELKLADLTNYRAYIEVVNKTAPNQIVGLVLSVSLMLGLAVYSCMLHRKITKRNIALTVNGGTAESRYTTYQLGYHDDAITQSAKYATATTERC